MGVVNFEMPIDISRDVELKLYGPRVLGKFGIRPNIFSEESLTL